MSPRLLLLLSVVLAAGPARAEEAPTPEEPPAEAPTPEEPPAEAPIQEAPPAAEPAEVAPATIRTPDGAGNVVEVYRDDQGWKLKADGEDLFLFGMNWGYVPIGENYSEDF